MSRFHGFKVLGEDGEVVATIVRIRYYVIEQLFEGL
jgi:hypothetical protein